MTPSTLTVAETLTSMESVHDHMKQQGLAASAGAVRNAIEHLRPLTGTADALDVAIQAAIVGMGEERTAFVLRKALDEMDDEALDEMIRQVGGTD